MSIKPLREVQQEAILAAVLESDNITQAAIALGIAKSTIYDMMNSPELRRQLGEIRRAKRQQRCLEL